MLLVTHVALDVLLSRVINQPIKYTIEISSFYYMVAVVFLPLASVERRGEHINVDFIVAVLPSGPRRIVGTITSLLGAAVAAFVSYRTAIDAFKSTLSGEIVMGTGFLVIWPARWILPISFALLAISMIVGALARSTDTANVADARSGTGGSGYE